MKKYYVNFRTIDMAGLMSERYRNKAKLLMDNYVLSEDDPRTYEEVEKIYNRYYDKSKAIENALFNIEGKNKLEWKYIEVLKQTETEERLSRI